MTEREHLSALAADVHRMLAKIEQAGKDGLPYRLVEPLHWKVRAMMVRISGLQYKLMVEPPPPDCA